MPRLLAAIAVHALTASGVVWALFALLAAFEARWEAMFLWLGLALVVDAIDGPLARAVSVTDVLPRFSGERLDMIVDYLTYVVVPAVAIARSGLVPAGTGEFLACAILVSSLYHFADLESKTSDYFFRGFPAVWNIVALYIFAFAANPWVAFAAIAFFVAATFVPLTWVHPLRVVAFRPATLGVILVVAAAALYVILTGFPASLALQTVLGLSVVYLIAIGWIGHREPRDIERN